MFTILEDDKRSGLIEKLEDIERNFNVKAFDFSVVKDPAQINVFTALVQYEKRLPPIPVRGW